MSLYELADAVLCQMMEEIQSSSHLSISERASIVKEIAEAAQLFSETESNHALTADVLKSACISDSESEPVAESVEEAVVEDEVAGDVIDDTIDEAIDESDDFEADAADVEVDSDEAIDEPEQFADEDLELEPLPQNAEQDWDVFGAARDVIEYGIAGEFVDERE